MPMLDLIAIDGPSGAGKSTTAKRVAEALKWHYLDTGAMYRATALAVHRAGVDLAEAPQLEGLLKTLELGQEGTRMFLQGEDVSDIIRTPEVTKLVTPVSANARVREVLVDQQRKIGKRGQWVVDGRDIGTVVFPEACLKIFLIASVDARASRRWRELQAKGTPITLAEVKADLERRDYADSSRTASPLLKAPDAIEVDSSHLNIHEVVDEIVLRYLRLKG